MTRPLRAALATVTLIVAGAVLTAPPALGGGAAGRNPYFQTPVYEKLKKGGTLDLLHMKTYQQDLDHTCGAAAAMMVAVYLGAQPNLTLDKETEHKVAEEMGSDTDYGTSPEQVAGWLNQHGMDATVEVPGSLDTLRANLAAGNPTLVEWIDWGGHWAVAIGYDTLDPSTPYDDVIILADSADYGDDKRDGITYFNAKRFESMWFDAQYFPKPVTDPPTQVVSGVMISVKRRPASAG